MKELTQEQITTIQMIRETGYLDAARTRKVLLDMNSETYMYFYKHGSTYRREVFRKEFAIRKKVEEITGCPGSLVLKECKTAFVVFNPKNNNTEYSEYGEFFYNEFDVAKTQLWHTTTREFEGVSRFSSEAPFTYLLLKNLFGTAESIEYYLNWLASAVNTRDKLLTTIMILGSQGTGKGVLTNILKEIYGREYLLDAGSDSLNGSFNGDFQNKCFIVFNEVAVDFTRKSAASEKIKELITDPRMRINIKYGGQFVAENYANMHFFSNDNTPLKLDPSDRRFSVFKPRKQLAKVAEESGYDIQDFVDHIMEEKDKFITLLFSYRFDMKKANRALVSMEKDALSAATSSKIDTLAAMLHSGDFISIKELVEETVDIKAAKGDLYDGRYRDALISIAEDMSAGRITNKNAVFLYGMLVDEEEKSSIKIGTKLNAAIGKSIGGGGVKYRKLENAYVSSATDTIESVIEKLSEEDKADIEERINDIFNEKHEEDTVVSEVEVVEEVEEVEDYSDVYNDCSLFSGLPEHEVEEAYKKEYVHTRIVDKFKIFDLASISRANEIIDIFEDDKFLSAGIGDTVYKTLKSNLSATDIANLRGVMAPF